jgi:NADPH:quinone reductase-like Zn-dependent oxidoreductase
MTSQYCDAGQAQAYHEFQYHFPEKTLAGETIIVADGTGALSAATVALLAREGAHLVVGYRTNRERAKVLRRAITSVAFEDLNRETLLVSLESNRVGLILLAKEIGAAMESSNDGGSAVLLATTGQAIAVDGGLTLRRDHP